MDWKPSGYKDDSVLARRALDWWRSLPLQDIKNCRSGLANLVMKYYPDKTDCQNVSIEEILYIYIRECEAGIVRLPVINTHLKGTVVEIVTPTFFIRSKTNLGDLAKQYFTVVKDKDKESALIITKFVYTDEWRGYSQDSCLVRVFRGKGLFVQRFGIKMNTLDTVLSKIY